jgi:hypothetical protein
MVRGKRQVIIQKLTECGMKVGHQRRPQKTLDLNRNLPTVPLSPNQFLGPQINIQIDAPKRHKKRIVRNRPAVSD